MAHIRPADIRPGSNGYVLQTVNGVPAWVKSPAAGSAGDIPVGSGSGTTVNLGVGSNNQVLTADSTKPNSLKWASRTLPVIDVVTDHGAVVDGTTDDTAAWQAALTAAGTAGGARIISSRSGVSIIAGALQDTSGANAQLLLPAVDYVDSENITVVIEGAFPPPPVFSVIGATPLPDNHLVLKSTLTSGSGGALLGGYGPAGTLEGFTNVMLRMENVTLRLPSNPTHSALDARHIACLDLDNVSVDAGSYNVGGMSEQTTATSYGIRTPVVNNGAYTRLGATTVIGFYNGYEFGEHTVGIQVNAGACRRAFVFIGAHHASSFQRLMPVHCQRGMVFVGGAPNHHYVDVDQFNVEHASSGTWVPVYDIDDASNYGKGKVKWSVILAGTGQDTSFAVNGATGISASRVGTETAVPTSRLISAGTLLTGGGDLSADRTLSVDTTALDERTRDTIGTALVAGPGVTITVNDSGDTITIQATGELLVQDGTSNPPVLLTNEAGTDHLYQG